ncbi:unnamed protein product [Anisakis simplex]|nr:unnamed protein product [Anisakis simplex]
MQSQPILSQETGNGSSSRNQFCLVREDGLYRHPKNCANIIQCFGGEQFEYESCSRGLVFNEVSGGCDYRANVPDCANYSAATATAGPSSDNTATEGNIFVFCFEITQMANCN